MAFIYLSRIASEVKEYSLSLPCVADSKGENPRGSPRNEHAQDMSCACSGPGLALGFETFHGTAYIALALAGMYNRKLN